MEVFTDASSMREYSRTQRRLGHKIALVPTMVSAGLASTVYLLPELTSCYSVDQLSFIELVQGYLHEGHMSLVHEARCVPGL